MADEKIKEQKNIIKKRKIEEENMLVNKYQANAYGEEVVDFYKTIKRTKQLAVFRKKYIKLYNQEPTYQDLSDMIEQARLERNRKQREYRAKINEKKRLIELGMRIQRELMEKSEQIKEQQKAQEINKDTAITNENNNTLPQTEKIQNSNDNQKDKTLEKENTNNVDAPTSENPQQTQTNSQEQEKATENSHSATEASIITSHPKEPNDKEKNEAEKNQSSEQLNNSNNELGNDKSVGEKPEDITTPQPPTRDSEISSEATVGNNDKVEEPLPSKKENGTSDGEEKENEQEKEKSSQDPKKEPEGNEDDITPPTPEAPQIEKDPNVREFELNPDSEIDFFQEKEKHKEEKKNTTDKLSVIGNRVYINGDLTKEDIDLFFTQHSKLRDEPALTLMVGSAEAIKNKENAIPNKWVEMNPEMLNYLADKGQFTAIELSIDETNERNINTFDSGLFDRFARNNWEKKGIPLDFTIDATSMTKVKKSWTSGVMSLVSGHIALNIRTQENIDVHIEKNAFLNAKIHCIDIQGNGSVLFDENCFSQVGYFKENVSLSDIELAEKTFASKPQKEEAEKITLFKAQKELGQQIIEIDTERNEIKKRIFNIKIKDLIKTEEKEQIFQNNIPQSELEIRLKLNQAGITDQEIKERKNNAIKEKVESLGTKDGYWSLDKVRAIEQDIAQNAQKDTEKQANAVIVDNLWQEIQPYYKKERIEYINKKIEEARQNVREGATKLQIGDKEFNLRTAGKCLTTIQKEDSFSNLGYYIEINKKGETEEEKESYEIFKILQNFYTKPIKDAIINQMCKEEEKYEELNNDKLATAKLANNEERLRRTDLYKYYEHNNGRCTLTGNISNLSLQTGAFAGLQISNGYENARKTKEYLRNDYIDEQKKFLLESILNRMVELEMKATEPDAKEEVKELYDFTKDVLREKINLNSSTPMTELYGSVGKMTEGERAGLASEILNKAQEAYKLDNEKAKMTFNSIYKDKDGNFPCLDNINYIKEKKDFSRILLVNKGAKIGSASLAYTGLDGIVTRNDITEKYNQMCEFYEKLEKETLRFHNLTLKQLSSLGGQQYVMNQYINSAEEIKENSGLKNVLFKIEEELKNYNKGTYSLFVKEIEPIVKSSKWQAITKKAIKERTPEEKKELEKMQETIDYATKKTGLNIGDFDKIKLCKTLMERKVEDDITGKTINLFTDIKRKANLNDHNLKQLHKWKKDIQSESDYLASYSEVAKDYKSRIEGILYKYGWKEGESYNTSIITSEGDKKTCDNYIKEFSSWRDSNMPTQLGKYSFAGNNTELVLGSVELGERSFQNNKNKDYMHTDHTVTDQDIENNALEDMYVKYYNVNIRRPENIRKFGNILSAFGTGFAQRPQGGIFYCTASLVFNTLLLAYDVLSLGGKIITNEIKRATTESELLRTTMLDIARIEHKKWLDGKGKEGNCILEEVKTEKGERVFALNLAQGIANPELSQLQAEQKKRLNKIITKRLSKDTTIMFTEKELQMMGPREPEKMCLLFSELTRIDGIRRPRMTREEKKEMKIEKAKKYLSNSRVTGR